MKNHWLVGFGASLLAACAITPNNDFYLNDSARSATVFVVAPDGQRLNPYGEHAVKLPGVFFTDRALIHPGTYSFGLDCTLPNITPIDFIPNVRATVVAGHSYELRCGPSGTVLVKIPAGT